MTVWFTSGLSIAAWIRPVLAFALPIALVCALLSLVVAPWAIAQSAEYQRLLESRDEVSNVTPGLFVESRSTGRVFFVDKLSEKGDELNNIFVQSTQNGRLGVIVARRGYIETAKNGDRFAVLLTEGATRGRRARSTIARSTSSATRSGSSRTRRSRRRRPRRRWGFRSSSHREGRRTWRSSSGGSRSRSR
jgi:Predicted permeases